MTALINDDVVGLLMEWLDPFSELDMATLQSCLTVNHQFFHAAARAIWSEAILVPRRGICLNADDAVEASEHEDLPSRLKRLQGKRLTKEGGGEAWRWGVYMQSVRRIAITTQFYSSKENGWDNVKAIAPWLGRIGEVVLDLSYPKERDVVFGFGAWMDKWVAWLLKRRSDAGGNGGRPTAVRVIACTKQLVMAFLKHPTVKALALTPLDSYTDHNDGRFLAALLSGINHGLEVIKLGRDDRDRCFTLEECDSLMRYATEHKATLRSLDLFIRDFDLTIPEGLPVKTLRVHLPILGAGPLHVEGARSSLLELHHHVIPKDAESFCAVLRRLTALHILDLTIPNRSYIDPLCESLASIPALRRLRLEYCETDGPDIAKVFGHLTALTSLTLWIPYSMNSPDFQAAYESLPRLEHFEAKLPRNSKVRIALKTNLKSLALNGLPLIVDPVALTRTGLPNLERLYVLRNFPEEDCAKDRYGNDCTEWLTSRLADESFVPRLQKCRFRVAEYDDEGGNFYYPSGDFFIPAAEDARVWRKAKKNVITLRGLPKDVVKKIKEMVTKAGGDGKMVDGEVEEENVSGADEMWGAVHCRRRRRQTPPGPRFPVRIPSSAMAWPWTWLLWLIGVAVAYYLTKNILLVYLGGYLEATIGLHVDSLGLRAGISGLTFTPKPKPRRAPDATAIHRLHDPPDQAAPSAMKLALTRLEVGRIQLRFHTATRECPSLITCGVQGVRVVLVVKSALDPDVANGGVATPAQQAPPPSPSSAPPLHAARPASKGNKALQMVQRNLKALSKYLRVGVIQFLLRVVDLSVTDIDVTVLESRTGGIMLRHVQASARMAMTVPDLERSDAMGAAAAEDTTAARIAANASHGATGGRFSAFVTLSPFETSLYEQGEEPGRRMKPILQAETHTTMEVSHGASLAFGTLSDPSVVVRISGVTVVAGTLIRLLMRLKALGEAFRARDPKRGGGLGVPTSSSRRGSAFAEAAQEKPFGPDEVKEMMEVLQNSLMQTFPTVAVSILNTAVSLSAEDLRKIYPELSSASFRLPSLLASFESITVNASVIRNSLEKRRGTSTIKLSASIKNSFLDAYGLTPHSTGRTTTIQVATVKEVILNFSLLLPTFSTAVMTTLPVKNSSISLFNQLGELSAYLVVDSPKVTLTDEFILITAECAAAVRRMDFPTTSPPPRRSRGVDITAIETILKSDLAKSLRISLRVQAFAPSLAVRLTRYNPSSYSPEAPPYDAVAAIGMEEISFAAWSVLRGEFGAETAVAPPVGAGGVPDEAAGGEVLARADFEIIGAHVRAHAVEGGLATSEVVEHRRDQLVALNWVKVHLTFSFGDAATVIPAGGPVGPPAMAVKAAATTSDLVMDLAPLGAGSVLDYKAVAGAIGVVAGELSRYGMPMRKGSVASLSRILDEPRNADKPSHGASNPGGGAIVMLATLRTGKVVAIASETGTFGFLVRASEVSTTVNVIVAVDERGISGPPWFTVAAAVTSVNVYCFNEKLLHTGDQALELFAEVPEVSLRHGSGEAGGAPVPPSVNVPLVTLAFSFRKLYVTLVSVLMLVKLGSKMPRRAGRRILQQEKVADVLAMRIGEARLTADIGSKLRGNIDDITVMLRSNKGIMITGERVHVETVAEALSAKWEELAIIQKVSLSIVKIEPRLVPTFDIGASSLLFMNPNELQLNFLFEDLINLSKAIKNLVFEKLEMTPSNALLSSGRSRFSDVEIPIVNVSVDSVSFKILDSEFEAALSRNYRKGREEQLARISRDKAFQRRAAAMRASRGSEKVDIEKAWWALQEFNAGSWINIIRKTSKHCPSLFSAKLSNVTVSLTPPILPANTIEESLRMIDGSTPDNIIYDDLIARTLTVTLSDANIRLRDYPLPLINLPNSGGKTLKLEGLLIVADPVSPIESKRVATISLHPIPVDPVPVYRSINPVKIYLVTSTVITSPSTISVNWGAAFEPCMVDVVRILDSFTKPSLDPSPPVGWWDKMRIILHGRNSIRIQGGGSLRIRIVGSTVPHFDARYHAGTEGLELIYSQGIQIDIGGDEDFLIVDCGQLAFSIPLSEFEKGKILGARRVEIDEDNLLKLKGGVRIKLGVKFMTMVTGAESGILGVETEFIKRHSEVILRHPDYIKRDAFGKSPLANIPIHRGSLYDRLGVPLKKPKLGRCLGKVRIKGTMAPLVLSFICERVDASGAVGIRCRADAVAVDLVFKQRAAKRLGEVSGQTLKSKTTRWLLDESSMDLTKVEGRVIAFSSAQSDSSPSSGVDLFNLAFDDEEVPMSNMSLSVEEDPGWFLDTDREFMDTTSDVTTIPFVWAPKIVYYKRPEGDVVPEEEKKVHADMHNIQAELFTQRIKEIESSIQRYNEAQKGIEYRETVFSDDGMLIPRSMNITEKLDELREKKDALEKELRKFAGRMETEESPVYNTSTGSVFAHRYIIHNVRYLWKRDVRNSIFKFFDCIERESSLKHCLSNAALKTAKELVVSVANRAGLTMRKSASMKSLPVTESLDNKSVFDQNMADELLEYLVSSANNDVASDEVPNDDARPKESSYTSQADSPTFDYQTYTPSDNPESPDYISPNQRVECNWTVELINPQINLESLAKESENDFHSVLISAEKCFIRSVGVLDEFPAGSYLALDEDRDRNIELIKSRLVVNVKNAQFYVARKLDVDAAVAADNDRVMNQGGFIDRQAESWPVWVPLECLTDLHPTLENLQQVVKGTSASFHRDKINTLYVNRQSAAAGGAGASSGRAETDSVSLNFPDFRVGLNASQYMIFGNIISNLIVYRDPTRGERNAKLRKILLALEQMEDLRKVMETVLSLQYKIRQAEAFLRFGGETQDHGKNRDGDIRRVLLQYQDELYIIMNGLRSMYIMEQKRKSVDAALQVQFLARNLEWEMILDNDEPFAKWIFNSTTYRWIHYEDQSSAITLEIDKFIVENQLPNRLMFPNLLAAYNVDSRVLSSRNKMLRLYWRELAPVAGIPVVDHFEINIFPLELQMTREIGRQFEFYFFPERKSRAAAKAAAAEERQEKQQQQAGAPNGNVGKGGPSASAGVEDGRHQAGSVAASGSTLSDALEKKRRFGPIAKPVSERNRRIEELRQMQMRAAKNKSFIYIKVPGVVLCLSYKGVKEKNLEDLNRFTFRMPTLEYRNQTWSWMDMFAALKKDTIRAVVANSGALVREKLLKRKGKEDNRHKRMGGHNSSTANDDVTLDEDDDKGGSGQLADEDDDDRSSMSNVMLANNAVSPKGSNDSSSSTITKGNAMEHFSSGTVDDKKRAKQPLFKLLHVRKKKSLHESDDPTE
ncbi:hypothetical protein HK101_008480 [Irineochytrium annulatum]|nr:hypothetical protein HK101_008480 [Irineochytrium annulatum]